MTRIQLQLEPERKALYAAASARLQGVELVSAEADALITDTPGASPLPTLLDQPDRIDLSSLVDLPSSRIMPAHLWRFSPSVLPVAESRRSGQLGEPGLLRIHHWLTTPSDPLAMAFAQVDLAHWLFGCRPRHIHTLSRENYLHYHLGFPDGGMALIDIATSRPGEENYYSMHLVGSEGAAYADDHRNVHLQFGAHGARARLHAHNELLAVQAMLAEFLTGLREDHPWSVELSETHNALETAREALN